MMLYVVPHDRLLTKIVATGVDLRVIVWVQKFLLGRSQRVRLDGQIADESRINAYVPQGNVLIPVFFLASVNNIWRNIESNIRFFCR